MSNQLQFECKLGKPNIGKETYMIGMSIDKSAVPIGKMEQFFCNRILGVKVFQSKAQLDMLDEGEKLPAIKASAEVKGFNSKKKFSSALVFKHDDIELHDFVEYAWRDVTVQIESSEKLPEKKRGRKSAEKVDDTPPLPI